MEKLAVASYSFSRRLKEGTIDLFGYLETDRYHYGMHYADIWNGYFKSYDEDYLKKVRQALDERDLVLANICCDGGHPWADRDDYLRMQAEMADNCMRAAEILGAKSLRIDVGILEMEPTEQQMEFVAKAFEKFAQRGYDHGYKVGPENHWGASKRFCVQKELHDRVNHPGYGMLIHVSEWKPDEGETQFDCNVKASPWAMHTHVDYEHAPDAVELLPPMRAAGYQGVWSAEHHTEEDEYTRVEHQLAMIRLAHC